METISYDDETILNQIKKVMETFKINNGVMASILRMKPDLLKSFLKREKELESLPYHHKLYIIDITTMFVYTRDSISSEERLKIVIEGMQIKFGVSIETVALYCSFSKKKIEDYLNNPDSLSDKEKFDLSMKVMFLYGFLKFPNYELD
ncbi:MAG: HTH domain-containing protein [Coprobacillaceae bacterium]